MNNREYEKIIEVKDLELENLRKQYNNAWSQGLKLQEENFHLEKDNKILRGKLYIKNGGYGKCEKCGTRTVIFCTPLNPMENINE